MNLQKIVLSATHSNWRLFMVRKADQKFLAFQDKVFARDHHTCQFCGFTAITHMDVVNLDGNFHHNSIGNLATACCFCAQCFFLESVGRSECSGGSLVLLPEMTQNELNALCHILFSAIVSGSAAATQARNMYRSLKLRSQPVEKLLGDGLNQPSLLGRLLVDYGIETSTMLLEQLQVSVRLLPDLQKFADPVKVWLQHALQQANEGVASNG